MTRQEPHRDVAAYALGVLEPGDAIRFEEHLPGCMRCTVHLSDFTAMAEALRELAEPGGLPTAPSPELLDRLTGRVRAQRRRAGRRRWAMGAAAAALVVALPVGVVAVHGPGAPAAPVQRVAASDPVSGVRASVALADHGWGTSVAMRLSDLPGPRTCQLVAVGTDGAEYPVLSWRVPESGYGIDGATGSAGPLEIAGGTMLRSAEIGRWEVWGENGERLLSIGG
ncbi:anti-sigma factor family protein [Streptomyces sp. C10-9-1]|uniref:anti-sigma factor family protein n=1 Tax=Streptomyces sp. C10-9-1 TaxID=1859285 RepID=UPI003D7469FF